MVHLVFVITVQLCVLQQTNGHGCVSVKLHWQKQIQVIELEFSNSDLFEKDHVLKCGFGGGHLLHLVVVVHFGKDPH